MSGYEIHPGDPWAIIRRGPPMKVYFDMDGVLADFAGGFREMCGKDAPVQGTPADDAVYEAIRGTPHFFLRLKPYDDMLQLFQKLRDTGNIDCIILTGLPKLYRGIEEAEPDKRGWVDEYLGPDTEFIAVDRRHKADYAEGNILIDDYPPNIEDWEAAGGRGILYGGPRGLGEDEILGILAEHKLRSRGRGDGLSSEGYVRWLTSLTAHG